MVYCSREKIVLRRNYDTKLNQKNIICFYGNYKRKYHSILSVKINYILKMVHFHLLFSTFHIKHSTCYFFPLRSFVYFKVLFCSALHSIHIFFLWKHSQQIHGLPYCLPFLLFNYIIIVIMLIAVAYIFSLSIFYLCLTERTKLHKCRLRCECKCKRYNLLGILFVYFPVINYKQKRKFKYLRNASIKFMK